MYGSNSSSSTPSASSASRKTSLLGEYEVFLSFCGKDTRNGFTDFLYTDLRGAGVRTFRDDNELRVGKKIGPEFIKAIENSKISIPIFSKNYASSKWCLLELAQIVKCYTEAKREKIIFPIFYDVEPHDVKHQSGSYEEAFRQHEKKKRLAVQTVQIWREALTKVGELKGLELQKETGGREGELVKLIVKKCLQFLEKHYQHVPKNMIGMENHIRNLNGLLDIHSNEMRIIGVHGMGGLGKTTMAKIIYNQLCEYFEGHCFLENIREKSSPRDRIVNLQNQLMSNIQNREAPNFNDFYEGSNKIKEVVREKKLLIVLDDVDEKFQVDMLIGSENWFSVQSRIIITTRNKSVLDAIERASQRDDMLYGYASYKPDFMDDHHSLQLFSNYAFQRDSPPQEYNILSKEVVSIAAGLPLALVVFGSTFSEVQGEELWEDNVKMLRETLTDEVLGKLRFSFEALKYGQKQIFLDIACHFIGKNVVRPSYMWDDCKFYSREGINTLINRSLITIGDGNVFKMHDQLRDLGRQIVCEGLNELGKRSRFWCEEDVMQMLESSQEANCVNSICIPFDEILYKSIYNPRGRRSGLPCYRPSYIPLDVSHFPNLPNIRYLSLEGYDLNGHFKYPLSNLRWLKWTCSGKFRPINLPTKLVTLDLSYSDFTDDWEGWSQLKMGKKLRLLDFSNSSRITRLPDLSTFASLEVLILNCCEELRTLDGVQGLTSLKCLDASGCDNLEALPRLSNLTNLVKLHLSYCSKIIAIPGLENLESLQYLVVSNCYSLQSLDCSKLKNLKRLYASDCLRLTEIWRLEELKSLEELSIDGCQLIEALPNFSNLKELINFNASRCVKIYAISGLEELKFLESLLVARCNLLEILPNLSKLENLKTVDVSDCVKLNAISGLWELKSLERLSIVGCKAMGILPNLSKLEKLKTIDAYGCVKLTAITRLGKLKSLQKLDVAGCKSMEILPNLSKLENLKTLDVSDCVKLTVISGVGELKSLEQLSIAGCKSMEILPNLSKLKNLYWLCASDCVKLTAISGLGELKSLEDLDISGCESLEKLPNLSKLENLTNFFASGCVKLTLILGLEELKSLQGLYVDGCEGLGNLPDLPNTFIYRGLLSCSSEETLDLLDGHCETSHLTMEMENDIPQKLLRL